MSATTDFSLLNTYFSKVYVITLQRAAERHHRLREHLNGLNYTLLYGADNRAFSLHELAAQGIYSPQQASRRHRYGKEMSPGQVGCSWSHRMVYEEVVQQGYDKVLVLEDDVLPHPPGFAALAAALAELPPDWQLLYFDYLKNTRPPALGWLKQGVYHLQKLAGRLPWSHATIRHLYARPHNTHLRRAGFHEFTSAYAITQTAARQLLALQTPIQFIADNLLAHAATNQLLNAFIMEPKLFVQESQVPGSEVISYVEG